MKQRFVTYIEDQDTDTVLCMSEEEFDKSGPEANLIVFESAEFVWQFADSKAQAISQHFDKHNDWRADPEKATY